MHSQARKQGFKRTFIIVSTAQALSCVLLPLTAPIDSGTAPEGWVAFTLLVLVYGVVQITNSMAMTVTGMLTANAARSHQRGTVMGLQQMLSSIGRTAGPAGGALMLAWSLEGNGLDDDGSNPLWLPRAFPLDFHLVWFTAALCGFVSVAFTLLLPASIDRKMDGAPKKAGA